MTTLFDETKLKNSSILVIWMLIKEAVELLELDVAKNINGNNEAGIRVRHGFRFIKRATNQLLKLSLERDKKRIVKRKSKC